MIEHADETATVLGQIGTCLDDVEAALSRLDDGTYATCLSCGGAIGDEALDAEPTSRLCKDCAASASEAKTPQRELPGPETG